ncbi:hypothetical protein IAU59_007563 [Kwoniella sp. CBS 9459]
MTGGLVARGAPRPNNTIITYRTSRSRFEPAAPVVEPPSCLIPDDVSLATAQDRLNDEDEGRLSHSLSGLGQPPENPALFRGTRFVFVDKAWDVQSAHQHSLLLQSDDDILVIPSEHEELSPGYGFRLASGITDTFSRFRNRPRVSFQHLWNCNLAGSFNPDDLDEPYHPPDTVIDPNPDKKHAVYSVITQEEDYARVSAIVENMDRFFTSQPVLPTTVPERSTGSGASHPLTHGHIVDHMQLPDRRVGIYSRGPNNKTREQFYRYQDAIDEGQGERTAGTSKTFIHRFMPVFESASPAFRLKGRRKYGKNAKKPSAIGSESETDIRVQPRACAPYAQSVSLGKRKLRTEESQSPNSRKSDARHPDSHLQRDGVPIRPDSFSPPDTFNAAQALITMSNDSEMPDFDQTRVVISGDGDAAADIDVTPPDSSETKGWKNGAHHTLDTDRASDGKASSAASEQVCATATTDDLIDQKSPVDIRRDDEANGSELRTAYSSPADHTVSSPKPTAPETIDPGFTEPDGLYDAGIVLIPMPFGKTWIAIAMDVPDQRVLIVCPEQSAKEPGMRTLMETMIADEFRINRRTTERESLVFTMIVLPYPTRSGTERERVSVYYLHEAFRSIIQQGLDLAATIEKDLKDMVETLESDPERISLGLQQIAENPSGDAEHIAPESGLVDR